MDFILSEKTNNALIIHPIYNTLLFNNPKKYLAMPKKFNLLDNPKDDDIFIKERKPLNTNYHEIFMSIDTFFISCFDTKTFNERITLINDAIDAGRNVMSVKFLIHEFLKGLKIEALNNKKDTVDDIIIDKFIETYKKFKLTFYNEEYDYKTLFMNLKNMISHIEL